MQININNTKIFYEHSGSGQPLILLHGNGEDHHSFDAIAPKLAAHFSVYCIDSRNHGKSSRTAEFSYQAMAGDIAAFICELQLAPVNIIGFSDGAIISLLLALSQPRLIKRMALLGVNLKPSDFTAESYRLIEETYAQTQDPLFQLMLTEPNIELASLKTVNIPTFIIAGENDIFRPQLFAQLAATLPHARLKIISAHDHASYIVGNDLLAADFIEFFA